MKCFHLIIIFKFLEEEYLEVKNMNFKKKKVICYQIAFQKGYTKFYSKHSMKTAPLPKIVPALKYTFLFGNSWKYAIISLVLL